MGCQNSSLVSCHQTKLLVSFSIDSGIFASQVGHKCLLIIFASYCDKIADRSNLSEERFILTWFLEVIAHHGGDGTIVEICSSGSFYIGISENRALRPKLEANIFFKARVQQPTSPTQVTFPKVPQLPNTANNRRASI